MLSEIIKKLDDKEVNERLLEQQVPLNFWDGFRKPFLQQKQMLLFQILTKRILVSAEPRVGKTQVVMDSFRYYNLINGINRCMTVTDNETACVSLYNEYKNYGLKPLLITTGDTSKLDTLVPDSCDIIICHYRTLFAGTLFGYFTGKEYRVDYQKIKHFVRIHKIGYVVLDEVHNIKGHDTTSSEVATLLTDLVPFVTMLTGSPITTRTNKAVGGKVIALEDIYPYLRIANKEVFPNFREFIKENFTVTFDNKYKKEQYKVKDSKKTFSLLSDYYFSCTLQEMGIVNTKRHLLLRVTLPKDIRSKANSYKGTVKQPQYLSDYNYNDSPFINRKLIITESLLRSFKGFEKVLVVYQYKISEEALVRFLSEKQIDFNHLKAGLSVTEKKTFLESDSAVSLMSIGVSRTALPLHRYNIMIFYDVPIPPYSVIDFLQVSARINYPSASNESNFIYLIHKGMRDSKVLQTLLNDTVTLNNTIFKGNLLRLSNIVFEDY